MPAPRRASADSRSIETLIAEGREGRYPPVCLLSGTERFLVERAVDLLRRASLGDGPAGFNDDLFHGSASFTAQRAIGAARTLPMMARARFVLIRDADQAPAAELEALASYLPAAVDSTCFVMTASKLDGRTKLALAATKAGVLYEAKPLKGPALRRFAAQEAERRGHALNARAAEALVTSLGDDLAAIDDAVERLSLYVGERRAIDEQAVEACVTRVAADSIWALVDAVSLRNGTKALHAVGSLLDNREQPLGILGMVTRQLRIVARMREALAKKLDDEAAAKEAGAPPFKARELKESARRFTSRDLASAFATLARTDLALKGSKVPPERVLEQAILELCAGQPRARERLPRRQRTYR